MRQRICIEIEDCMEAKATITITIAPPPPPPLSIDASGVPTSGVVGQPFSGQIAIAGGTPPDTLSVDAGALPPGLTLDDTGLISGTPTEPGTFTFEVDVKDSLG